MRSGATEHPIACRHEPQMRLRAGLIELLGMHNGRGVLLSFEMPHKRSSRRHFVDKELDVFWLEDNGRAVDHRLHDLRRCSRYKWFRRLRTRRFSGLCVALSQMRKKKS